MTDEAVVARWVERYVTAWNSNEERDIRALFSNDATYATEPYGEPWRGVDEIVAKWLAHKDEPGETTFDWKLVAIADDLAIVEGTTQYPDRIYSNLWLITLAADGRASAYVEWYMQRPKKT